MKAIDVLIVEDHELVRTGLHELLQTTPDINIIGEANNLREAEEKTLALKPDLILLDIQLPDGKGTDLLLSESLKEISFKTLVLTSFIDAQLLLEAIQNGLNGCLLKESNGTALIQAIKDTMDGKCIIDPNVAQNVFTALQSSREKDADLVAFENLSPQEKRVLQQVAQGLTNKQIGSALELSDKTVKNYLSNTLGKLGLSRRTEAAAFFWKTHPQAAEAKKTLP